MNNLVWLVFCHLIGDYVLQSDFLATTKGKNWYHLIVHCALYCMPFTVVFGITWHIGVLLATHIVVDAMKARYGVLSYIGDQAFHYLILLFMNLSGMGV